MGMPDVPSISHLRTTIQNASRLMRFSLPSSTTIYVFYSATYNTQNLQPIHTTTTATTTMSSSSLSPPPSPPLLKRETTHSSKLIFDWTCIERKVYQKRGYTQQLLDVYRRCCCIKQMADDATDDEPVATTTNTEPAWEAITANAIATTTTDQSTIHQQHNQHNNNKNNGVLVLITGPSGVGKTGLAMTLNDRVHQDGGCFCRGKFDQPSSSSSSTLREHQDTNTTSTTAITSKSTADSILASLMTSNNHNSFAPFVSAMTQYCQWITSGSSAACAMAAVQSALHQALDASEIQVLEESKPALRLLTRLRPHQHHNHHHATSSNNNDNDDTVFGQQEHWHGLKGPEAEKRYMHLFCKLVRAVSSPDHPLVFLLDDLQWADPTAMQLFRLLATSSSGSCQQGLLVIGTSRQLRKEESLSSSTSPWLHAIMEPITMENRDGTVMEKTPTTATMTTASVTHIAIDNLTEKEANELISDLLHLEPSDTQSLARIAHSQTGGNLFFLMQYLSVLNGENVLTWDEGMGRYTWSEDSMLKSHPQPSTVLDLLTQKILQLSDCEQTILQVASCLGGNIFSNLLSETVFPSCSILPALHNIQEQGLVQFDFATGSGSFLHDRIQEAAYSLILEEDRAKKHLDIGLRLWIWLGPAERDRHMFLIANQIIRGLHLLDDPVEKNDLAEFMLQAGEKAAKLSSFSTAAAYYDVGIRLLERHRHWKTNYKLSLSLYNAAAEVHYYNGNNAYVDLLQAKIFKHAKSQDDKFRAYFTQIYSLGSNGNMTQALNKGLEVLRSIGEAFPKEPGQFQSDMALRRCLWRLRKKTDEQILKLPLMRDYRKLVIMRLLNTIWGFTIIRDRLGPFLLKEMIEITFRHGLSPMCCVGFAAIGYYLGRRGLIEEGARFGRLGWHLMERFQADEWQCRVLPALLGGGCYRKYPLGNLVKPLQTAHRAGLVAGDVHIEEYRRLCDQYNQQNVGFMLTHQLQMCFNLMGKSSSSDDPLVLTGEAMSEAETMKAIEGKQPISLAWIWLMKHMLAVYFGRFDEAKNMASNIKASMSCLGAVLPFIPYIHLFLEGLAAAALSKTQKLEGKLARQILDKLKSNRHVTCQNFDNKIASIEAEMATSRGDRVIAKAKYAESAKMARQDGFLHEEALAYELAGRALLRWDELQQGCDFLESAKSLYGQWGALAKVKQLQTLIQEL